MIEVLQYVDRLGRNGFQKWYGVLDAVVRERVSESLLRLEGGNLAGLKSLNGGLLELRMDFGPGYWVYCGRERQPCDSVVRGHQEASARRYREGEDAMARVQGEKAADVTSMTVSFDDTLRADLENSGEFRREFLRGALRSMTRGEVDLGKSMLRKYVNATVGFIALGKALGRSPKTLMQMLGPKGNPHIKNFFEIVAYLQQLEGSVFDWPAQEAA